MDGEKMPLLCIGTAAKSRWPMVQGRRATAPLDYASSKKGWMTAQLFSTVLKKFNSNLKTRKVLIFIDNCPSHNGFLDIYDGIKSSLEIRMLPKRTTSMLQPCDQGVIRSLKANYRVKLAHLLLNKEAKDVSLYEGLMMVRSAWELNVSGEVIKNAWWKSGLLSCVTEQNEAVNEAQDNSDEFSDVVDLEDLETTSEDPTVDIDVIIDKMAEEAKSEDSDDDIDGKYPVNDESPPTISECLQAIRNISRRFIASTGEVPNAVTEVEQALLSIPQQQSKMTNLFQ